MYYGRIPPHISFPRPRVDTVTISDEARERLKNEKKPDQDIVHVIIDEQPKTEEESPLLDTLYLFSLMLAFSIGCIIGMVIAYV